jgi:hypothetical protein
MFNSSPKTLTRGDRLPVHCRRGAAPPGTYAPMFAIFLPLLTHHHRQQRSYGQGSIEHRQFEISKPPSRFRFLKIVTLAFAGRK